MWLWAAIVVLFLLFPKVWPFWARYRARVGLQRMTSHSPGFEEAAEGTVPAGLREALLGVSAELTAFGFEFVGFMQSHAKGYSVPRIQTVLWHRGERTFAVVGFAIADRIGVVVDFETLFADGWWLRTLNRRGHFILAPPDTGRIDDPYVATLEEQWRYHQTALASEEARVRSDAGFEDLLRHKNAAEHDENLASVRAGLMGIDEDTQTAHFTRMGAQRSVERLTAAAKRAATAPPLTGVLATKSPPDDLERKYQIIAAVNAEKPKSPARWAFWVSLIAFGASSLLLPQWRWLLSLIPFLLLHELGHWSAMRLFGHRDARIRFIPFLGAATLSTKQFQKLSHEMIVLLAGPLPGIVLALVLFRFIDTSFARNPYGLFAAIMLITINGLNLLPLHPFDGGRILHALITAGRPRLDVALKAVAGVAFLVGAIVMKDVTLAILAGIGFLVVRAGLQLARMDTAVRRRPEFSSASTGEARRRLIFDALPEPRIGEGAGWVQLAQQLEVSLSHGTPRLWPALPWGIVYVGCLGGLLAWGINVFSTLPAIGAKCPPRARATRLVCDAQAGAGGIDWSRHEPGSQTRNPFSLKLRTDYPFGAFVWCDGSSKAIGELAARLREVRAAKELCPALPWEHLPAETKAQRERARWTLTAISFGGYRAKREELLARVDRAAAALSASAEYDPETVRLYKACLEHGFEGAPQRQLAERIGRSASESCKRLTITQNVYVAGDGGPPDGDQADDDSSDGVDGPAVPPPTEPSARTARISVLLADPADFAPLGRYLCEAGCQVDVLPYGSIDPRLNWCY